MLVKLKVNLTENQIKKLVASEKKGESVALKLGHDQLQGNHEIALDWAEAKKIVSALNSKKKRGCQIMVSSEAMKGGFLGALIGGLASLIPDIIGLATGKGVEVAPIELRKIARRIPKKKDQVAQGIALPGGRGGGISLPGGRGIYLPGTRAKAV